MIALRGRTKAEPISLVVKKQRLAIACALGNLKVDF